MPLDIQTLSEYLIYIVCFIILLSETGVFFLFFLPGDSLLFTLGLLAHQNVINIGVIIPLLIVAAILGNMLGYWFGLRMRKGLLSARYTKRINSTHYARTELFYQRHGSATVFFARFIPVVRTFAPFVSGVVKMDYKKYQLYSILGGVTWIVSITLFGYFFGSSFQIKNMAAYGVVAIFAAIIATPLFLGIVRYLTKDK